MSKFAEARTLIADPKNWTQRTYARNEKGYGCQIKDGVSFCVIGALWKVGASGEDFLRLRDVVRKLNYEAASDYNDNNTHAKVLELLDAAN